MRIDINKITDSEGKILYNMLLENIINISNLKYKKDIVIGLKDTIKWNLKKIKNLSEK